MKLDNTKIKNAKTKVKSYKLFDGSGLYLHMLHTGGKVWRYKYTFNNKERSLTIGKHKDGATSNGFSLQEARIERAKAYGLVISGIDPAKLKSERKAESKTQESIDNPTGKTFKEATLEWINYRSLPDTKRNWKPVHKKDVISFFERLVFPSIGNRIIFTINDDDIEAILKPIQDRGTYEVLGRTLNRIDAVFKYAKNKKWCDINPAYGKAEYLPVKSVQHMNSVKENELPEFLNDLANYEGNIICKSAVEFVLLTHIRTDEIRFTQWEEIDLEKKLLMIPADRMKMPIAQTVPLSNQAIELLEKIKPITGSSKYVFASLLAMSKPISENGMLSVIYNMGWKGRTTVHGLRSTFSTIANETLKMRPDVVEASLAHKINDPVRGAYNHATYLEERTTNAQVWADYLDRLKSGADVVQLHSKKI